MGGMFFYERDLYPNNGFKETSTMASPDTNDREAIVDDAEAQVKATTDTTNKGKIFLVMFAVLALVVGVGFSNR